MTPPLGSQPSLGLWHFPNMLSSVCVVVARVLARADSLQLNCRTPSPLWILMVLHQPCPVAIILNLRRKLLQRVLFVRNLISNGHIARAAKTLTQEGLLPINTCLLQSLSCSAPSSFCSSTQLPDQAPTITVDKSDLHLLVKNRLNNGSSSGYSGWSGEFVYALMVAYPLQSAITLSRVHRSQHVKETRAFALSLCVKLALPWSPINSLSFSS